MTISRATPGTDETATGHSPVFTSPQGERRFLAAYDAAMRLWPVPYDEVAIPTDFGSTHVIVSGPVDAQPIVLLHCALMTSAIWSPIIGALAAGHRTYAVDVIGDVGRTVPSRPPDTERALADWLDQVFEGLDLDTALMLAWSFGGWVGTNFAMHHPDRVEKLALLAPFKPFGRQGLGFLYGMVPFIVRGRAGARSFERKMCFRDDFGHPEHSELLFERYRSGKLVLRVPPRTFTDLEFTLLTMPTLLLVGRQELLFDAQEAVARANHVLPAGHGELIEDCNHAMVSDQTDVVAAKVLDFFG